jgi:hypothetical protein
VHVTETGASQHRAIMRSISGLLIGTFFATLSTNILATALPRILTTLRVSVDGYTWVVTAYILMLTVSVPIWGRLAGSVIGGCATSSGALQQNVVLLVQNIIPRQHLGAGSGATQFSRFLGGALGVSALGALSAARVTVHVTSGLRAAGLPMPASSAVGVPDRQALPRAVAAVYERGYALAFADTFAALIPFSGAIIPAYGG